VTNAEIDALESLALRRAVSEAVGWEWRGAGYAVQRHEDGRLRCFRDFDDWNEVLAACEAANAGYINIQRDGEPGEFGPCVIIGVGIHVGKADGCDSEAVLRALLKALEAGK